MGKEDPLCLSNNYWTIDNLKKQLTCSYKRHLRLAIWIINVPLKLLSTFHNPGPISLTSIQVRKCKVVYIPIISLFYEIFGWFYWLKHKSIYIPSYSLIDVIFDVPDSDLKQVIFFLYSHLGKKSRQCLFQRVSPEIKKEQHIKTSSFNFKLLNSIAPIWIPWISH